VTGLEEQAQAGPEAAAPAFGLTPELLELQREARAFALERLRPRAAELEWRDDPRERVAWDLVEEASARGWRTLGLAEGATVLGLCVLIEELAYGDMGFAVLMDQTLKVQRILARLAPRAREDFLPRLIEDPRMVLAICFTEPDTGSDYITGTTDFRFATHAERRPDGGFVLNGEKRFISNGADAGMYLVFACTDPSKPAREGTGAFLVDRGTPGLEVAEVHEKISQRTINNARLRFTDVALGPERVIGDPHRGFAGAQEILKESAIEAGATTLGTGRAAYELAVEHARTRVQGGQPLIAHANVGCRLAQMYAELEAARSLIWRAAWAVEHDPAYRHELGTAAKVVAADAAMHACLSAAEIHGALAIMRGASPMEKFIRDCLSFLHSDGAQDSLRLRMADAIRRRNEPDASGGP
jgi:alkylation response protein AidB-like acyl-CoA dehydrogenase